MTPLEAFDAVAERFRDTWEADARTASVPIGWPEVEQDGIPPADGSEFARFTMEHSAGGQPSIGGADGVSMHDHTGTVIIQCFGKRSTGKTAKRAAYELARVAHKAFAGADAGGAWFRDVGLRDVGPDASWYQINVNATFTHYE